MRFLLPSLLASLCGLLVCSIPVLGAPTHAHLRADNAIRPMEPYARIRPTNDQRSLVVREVAQALFRLAERADTTPLEITIDGHKLKLEKHDSQGENGVVYVVTEGAGFVGDFAKTKVTETEITVTKAVGQSALSGKDTKGKTWLVVKKSPGMEITKTSAYTTAKAGGQTALQELCKKVETLGLAAVEAAHKASGYTHDDLTVQNLLFDSGVTRAYLIDWGNVHQNAPDAKTITSQIEHNFSAVCKAAPPPPPPRNMKKTRSLDGMLYRRGY